jgi:hypothetical protein
MARVVLLDENTGVYYTVLEDSLRIRKRSKRKVKLARNERQVEHIARIKTGFEEYQRTELIAKAFGSMLDGIVKGECTSVSLSTYRDEMQVTFWEKRGKGSVVLASFQFSSPDGFIAGIEELS